MLKPNRVYPGFEVTFTLVIIRKRIWALFLREGGVSAGQSKPVKNPLHDVTRSLLLY